MAMSCGVDMRAHLRQARDRLHFCLIEMKGC